LVFIYSPFIFNTLQINFWQQFLNQSLRNVQPLGIDNGKDTGEKADEEYSNESVLEMS